MLTRHAETRCQQRGIRQEVVQTLLAFGHRKYGRGGAELCFMNHEARMRARKVLGRRAYARVADRLNSYLVVAEDGAIITAAKRHRRLKF